MNIRDWIISLGKKGQKCGCKCKHTTACKKFSTDAKKATDQQIGANTQKPEK